MTLDQKRNNPTRHAWVTVFAALLQGGMATTVSGSSLARFCWLGICLLACQLVAAVVDPVRRADFLRRAANIEASGSSAFSHYMVGVSYLQGEEIERDEAAAIRWFRKAALMGDASAQHDLIYAYREGYGVAQDSIEARAWYLATGEVFNSPDLGPTPALAAEPESRARARAEELRRLIAQGEAQTKERWLALLSETYAHDLARDRPLALQGDPAAQARLGEMYLSGQGLPRDPVEGVAWLRLAEAAGNADARKAIARPSSQLTPAQAEQSLARAAVLRRQIASSKAAK
jgi:TPR repeat protein